MPNASRQKSQLLLSSFHTPACSSAATAFTTAARLEAALQAGLHHLLIQMLTKLHAVPPAPLLPKLGHTHLDATGALAKD